MGQDGAGSHKRDYVTIFQEILNPEGGVQHYWFKSYGDFAEWVDFALLWSFSGGGSAVNGATLSSLILSQGLSRLVILSDVTCISYTFRVLALIPAILMSVKPVVTITPFFNYVTKVLIEVDKDSQIETNIFQFMSFSCQHAK